MPGVRENGGQYTHAAIWTVMAFAAAGEDRRAWELFDLINPVHHGDGAEAIATYQVEPYVVAADVYTNPQHAGRGLAVVGKNHEAHRKEPSAKITSERPTYQIAIQSTIRFPQTKTSGSL